MEKALVAQWAGDFEIAAMEYDQLFQDSLAAGRTGEARLTVAPAMICRVASSIERGERDLGELLRHVGDISREKEGQINERLLAGADQIVKHVMHETSQVADALKRLMPYPSKIDEGEVEQRTGTPLRLSFGERRIVVFGTPLGLETRSYSRTDISVNLEASGERLVKDGGGAVSVRTDRMLEIEVLGETLEIFVDGRIRCVAETQAPSRLANLIREVADNLVT
jgi:hypothetical protein